MKENKNNADKKVSKEEYMYHNTELLLKKYREVVLSIEASAIHTQMRCELEFDGAFEDFFEISCAAGAEFSGVNIQEQMRTVERNKKMLKIIENAVNVLRARNIYGEEYYWILYYTYLSDKPCKTTEVIIDSINRKIEEYISWTSYFRLRKKAISSLSDILWGFTTKECLPIINEFIVK